SGFKISIADLSIRGAGTLLGAEQHGHIERVGYEMYIELLNRAIEELKTGKTASDHDIDFKVDASAYIRNDYVSARDKLRIYKRISAIMTIAERNSLIKELTEVYGDVDAPLRNLMGIALIKNLSRGLDVKRVVAGKSGVGVNFHSDAVFGNRELLGVVAEHAKDVVLTQTIPPSLVFNSAGLTPEEKIEMLVRFFSDVVSK
ncbi:MAG TPA: TRCF domain-containing protein, partial [Clostridia bacterium]|nr:TRCF domain-containing protein [Clostridia bacterium]